MSQFLMFLREPSEDHRVEVISDGFLILPHQGREDAFDALARRVVDHNGPFAAFSRRSDDGLYDCIHVLPHDLA